MAGNNTLELDFDVDINKASTSLKSVNTGLSSLVKGALRGRLPAAPT